MGEVYLAQDTRLDRKVALKILESRYVHPSAGCFGFSAPVPGSVGARSRVCCTRAFKRWELALRERPDESPARRTS